MTLICGDSLTELKKLQAESVDCCVTSPPYYGLRDYGIEGQMGQEPSPEEYVLALVNVFQEVRRVLKPHGTLWLNLGDTYATAGGSRTYGSCDKKTGRGDAPAGNRKPPLGLKPKDLIGIPWRVALALQEDGWWLRSDIIWRKPNAMPESVTDRPSRSHEYLFLLSKNKKYYYNQLKEPVKHSIIARAERYRRAKEKYGSPARSNSKLCRNGIDQTLSSAGLTIGRSNGSNISGRNKPSVWDIATTRFKAAHFAVMPEALVRPCILAGCPAGGTVLDPFIGAGTVGVVAARLGRSWIGIELNPEYVEIAKNRIAATAPDRIAVPAPGSRQIDLGVWERA